MDLLFTKEELGTKRFKVTRKRGDLEPLPTLDQSKVKLIVIVQNWLIKTCIYIFQMPLFNDMAWKNLTEQLHRSEDRPTKSALI